MGVEDIRGKLQKTAKLEMLRSPVFGSNRLWIENISFRGFFIHLICYLHLIDWVLANEFDEI